MTDPLPRTPEEHKSPDELRLEAMEIILRRKRGLPGYRGAGAPAPAAASRENALKAYEDAARYIKAGQQAEALRCADIAIGRAPAGSTLQADAWTLRGDIHLRQGMRQAARGDFGQALLVDPGHKRARILLAATYQQMGQPARAIQLYLEALALVQDPAERAQIGVLLADSYRANGRPDAARRVLRITGGVRPLGMRDRLRALRVLLAPGSAGQWLLIVLVALGSLWVGVTYGPGFAAALFVAALAMIAALRWWSTPA
jgi:tetratricopeptide (TPR) repeat protein